MFPGDLLRCVRRVTIAPCKIAPACLLHAERKSPMTSIETTYPPIRNLLTKNASVLDFGCGDGHFLQEVGDQIGEGIGIDLDKSLIEEAARCNRFPNVRYMYADAKGGLPFDAGRFDVIGAFGVLEHVGPEQPLLQELHRLLRPGGRLVIAVPSLGPFRVFDVGNVKYNYPRLHKWFYYHVAHQKEYYDERFGPEAEMFGQFSKEAERHKHYSARNLADVAAPWFVMENHVHYGVFYELIQFCEVLACKPFGRTHACLFSWLTAQDAKLLSPFGRANVVGIFRKS
jgi:SAM-dependent methyltransferase